MACASERIFVILIPMMQVLNQSQPGWSPFRVNHSSIIDLNVFIITHQWVHDSPFDFLALIVTLLTVLDLFNIPLSLFGTIIVAINKVRDL
jgi:hypothetical protein